MNISKALNHSVTANYVISMGEKGVLSNRQMEALVCTAKGCTSKETAEKMGITERTANAHIEDGMGKVGAINRPHFIAIAYTNRMIVTAKETGAATVQFLTLLFINSMIGLAVAPSVVNSDGTFTRPGRRQPSRVVRVRQARRQLQAISL